MLFDAKCFKFTCRKENTVIFDFFIVFLGRGGGQKISRHAGLPASSVLPLDAECFRSTSERKKSEIDN